MVLWYAMLCSLNRDTNISTPWHVPNLHSHTFTAMTASISSAQGRSWHNVRLCASLTPTQYGGREKQKQDNGGKNTQNRKSELSLSAYWTLCPHIYKTKSFPVNKTVILKSDLLWQFKVRWSLYMLIRSY